MTNSQTTRHFYSAVSARRAAIGRHHGLPSRKEAPNFYDPRAPHNQPFFHPNLRGNEDAEASARAANLRRKDMHYEAKISNEVAVFRKEHAIK